MRCIERKGSKKVRSGDKVVVIAGNAKGQFGTVLACMDDRVVVQGINIAKKSVKKSQQNPKGGVVEVERSIHVSNVCPCDESGAALKVKTRFNEQGEKELYYKKESQTMVWRSIKTKK